ncbi:hypothetical protein G6F61_012749 [Rhizopus arrhizus]|nr:hypothetical protein G6F61_012749 [Rhizopus arrhizus]
MLNEVCKTAGSNVAFLHFSSEKSASVFFDSYADEGITINGIHFTLYPAKFKNGEYVKYDDEDLNFNACIVPASATLPESTDTNATTVVIFRVYNIKKYQVNQ